MAKLIVFAAITVALLALAQASGSTATSTVDEKDLENVQEISKKCQGQIQQHGKQLRNCWEYLSSVGDQIEAKGTVIQDPLLRQQLRGCCQGLKSLQGDQCRCYHVKDSLSLTLRLRPYGQPAKQKINQEARLLTQNCKVGPRKCIS